MTLTDLPADGVPFQAAETVRQRIPSLLPAPWTPEGEAVVAWAEALEDGSEIFWMSDGLDQPWRTEALAAFEALGPVTVFETPRPVIALTPPVFDDGVVTLTAIRADTTGGAEVTVNAHGLDPAGTPRTLASAPIAFAPGAAEGVVELSLPPELRNRVTRFEIDGLRSAGAVSLTDDAFAAAKWR